MPVSKYEPVSYPNRTLRENKNGELYFIYNKKKYYPEKEHGMIVAGKNTVIDYELYLPKNLAMLIVYKKI